MGTWNLWVQVPGPFGKYGGSGHEVTRGEGDHPTVVVSAQGETMEFLPEPRMMLIDVEAYVYVYIMLSIYIYIYTLYIYIYI